MRISDWSSDVCSSDLADEGFQLPDVMLRNAGPDQRAARQPGILVIGREVGLTERLVGLHHAVVLLVPARLVAGGRCGGGGRRKDSTGKSGTGCRAKSATHGRDRKSVGEGKRVAV